ncbi:bifunctional diaminohydroxyphosphoribosylaminopyrimidine deaminase/5-amino-6-(5-phosphoribosylamino)uracil reductase RibD [Paracoccus sp. (in: a-proteobacteria)]|uniref:bifunctional diaminohydroxyphosphoribosylaminopyrimidine deaminase/5-amino-6-(5-phosphoribosylamino)uracil reductase RibD n=1 Tax=Paracoccus sp. TaxID=267 RepID=UPI0026DFA8CC|nr:bifunctional diaminohydroxyphosphoribosylaminopyrimidine deaminase/5-amino-6-(5-phosphoribosylamino)uracil reductase RibD [Paracoccus sp. (in: a-proteobacteria)]MDO5370958.1 bifunctional diaminohydroxyphosphoribosylaminopyrimidine deaminase/5-amino-6-(5-phosphoribosylamino)uracil reductase RibD [Paracoccus sp. (in: a-proteobacteria)]
MDHALRLARHGLGNVWPNPAVGCVIVSAGRVVGRGWTQPGGRPHAERMALDMAGPAARGATTYVTLEPCAHHGRTPPCAEGLVQAGVARVVTALTDPDPRVAGQGHAMLRAAGVEVVENVRSDRARSLQRGFLSRVTRGRPMVTLKLATSFDGRIATASGESRWITGEAARRHVHLLRLTHDAVMVGAGTARADHPALNVRGFGPVRQPVRVVLANGPVPALPPEGADHGPLWVVPGPPAEALAELGRRGLTRVFCEGGGRLAAALLAEGLVDELVGYTAGVLIGGDGRAAVEPLGLSALSDAPRFRLDETRALGGDVFHRWVSAEA